MSKKCLSQEHKATNLVSAPRQSSAQTIRTLHFDWPKFYRVSTTKPGSKIPSTYKQDISSRYISSGPVRCHSMAALHSVVLACHSVLSCAGFHRRRFYHRCSMKSMMTILHWLLRVPVLWLKQRVSYVRWLKSQSQIKKVGLMWPV